ncbi:MAG: hypothetical protein A4E32_02156 [Methanomassiliicoccales archaeon PtaU1.Bin124]|nr:MAG: hypothetical protein A4E32_02156 [Methanomassiliicoccales archaeon PtaU1.Bin124]
MDLETKSALLRAKPPFDLLQSFRFIERFHGPRFGMECDDQHHRRAGIIDDTIFLVNITAGPSTDEIRCDISTRTKIDRTMVAKITQQITDYLSLEDDLGEFYSLAKGDKVFEDLLKKSYGYHQVRFFTPFEAAAWSIITQRFPVERSRTIMERIATEIGGSIDLDGHTFLAFPEAHNILKNLDRLHIIVTNKRKTEYLTAAAEAFDKVDQEFFKKGSYSEVLGWLKGIKGIGDWSASLILIRGMGRVEQTTTARSIPKERAMKDYHIEGDPDALKRIASRYGNYQGLWEHYLLYWMD